MPTFREDAKIGSKVPLIKTADLSNHSVTEEKLADGSVTREKLSKDILEGNMVESISIEEIEEIVEEQEQKQGGEKGDIQ